MVLVFLLAWPRVTHSNWMISDTKGLCFFECIMTRGQSVHACMIDQETVSICNPLGGPNDGLTLTTPDGFFCASNCERYVNNEGGKSDRCTLTLSHMTAECNQNSFKKPQQLTIYGRYCITECGTSGYSYHWCHVDVDLKGRRRRWDYCAPG